MACKWLVKSWRSGRIILKMELSIDSTHWSMVEVDHLWKISDHVCFTVAVTGALHFHHRCCFLFNYSFIHVLFASVVVATVSNTSLPPHKPNENKWPMFQLKPERLVPNPKFHFSYLEWPKLPGSVTVPLFRPHTQWHRPIVKSMWNSHNWNWNTFLCFCLCWFCSTWQFGINRSEIQFAIDFTRRCYPRARSTGYIK